MQGHPSTGQAAAADGTVLSPQPPRAPTLPREILRWLQTLDLSYPVRNPKRDLCNGFSIAEICSRYWPDVPLHSLSNQLSSTNKEANWHVLRKVFVANGFILQGTSPFVHTSAAAMAALKKSMNKEEAAFDQLLEGTMAAEEGCAAALLELLYTSLTHRVVPQSAPLSDAPVLDKPPPFLKKSAVGGPAAVPQSLSQLNEEARVAAATAQAQAQAAKDQQEAETARRLALLTADTQQQQAAQAAAQKAPARLVRKEADVIRDVRTDPAAEGPSVSFSAVTVRPLPAAMMARIGAVAASGAGGDAAGGATKGGASTGVGAGAYGLSGPRGGDDEQQALRRGVDIIDFISRDCIGAILAEELQVDPFAADPADGSPPQWALDPVAASAFEYLLRNTPLAPPAHAIPRSHGGALPAGGITGPLSASADSAPRVAPAPSASRSLHALVWQRLLARADTIAGVLLAHPAQMAKLLAVLLLLPPTPNTERPLVPPQNNINNPSGAPPALVPARSSHVDPAAALRCPRLAYATPYALLLCPPALQEAHEATVNAPFGAFSSSGGGGALGGGGGCGVSPSVLADAILLAISYARTYHSTGPAAAPDDASGRRLLIEQELVATVPQQTLLAAVMAQLFRLNRHRAVHIVRQYYLPAVVMYTLVSPPAVSGANAQTQAQQQAFPPHQREPFASTAAFVFGEREASEAVRRGEVSVPYAFAAAVERSAAQFAQAPPLFEQLALCAFLCSLAATGIEGGLFATAQLPASGSVPVHSAAETPGAALVATVLTDVRQLLSAMPADVALVAVREVVRAGLVCERAADALRFGALTDTAHTRRIAAVAAVHAAIGTATSAQTAGGGMPRRPQGGTFTIEDPDAPRPTARKLTASVPVTPHTGNQQQNMGRRQAVDDVRSSVYGVAAALQQRPLHPLIAQRLLAWAAQALPALQPEAKVSGPLAAVGAGAAFAASPRGRAAALRLVALVQHQLPALAAAFPGASAVAVLMAETWALAVDGALLPMLAAVTGTTDDDAATARQAASLSTPLLWAAAIDVLGPSLEALPAGVPMPTPVRDLLVQVVIALGSTAFAAAAPGSARTYAAFCLYRALPAIDAVAEAYGDTYRRAAFADTLMTALSATSERAPELRILPPPAAARPPGGLSGDVTPPVDAVLDPMASWSLLPTPLDRGLAAPPLYVCGVLRPSAPSVPLAAAAELSLPVADASTGGGVARDVLHGGPSSSTAALTNRLRLTTEALTNRAVAVVDANRPLDCALLRAMETVTRQFQAAASERDPSATASTATAASPKPNSRGGGAGAPHQLYAKDRQPAPAGFEAVVLAAQRTLSQSVATDDHRPAVDDRCGMVHRSLLRTAAASLQGPSSQLLAPLAGSASQQEQQQQAVERWWTVLETLAAPVHFFLQAETYAVVLQSTHGIGHNPHGHGGGGSAGGYGSGAHVSDTASVKSAATHLQRRSSGTHGMGGAAAGASGPSTREADLRFYATAAKAVAAALYRMLSRLHVPQTVAAALCPPPAAGGATGLPAGTSSITAFPEGSSSVTSDPTALPAGSGSAAARLVLPLSLAPRVGAAAVPAALVDEALVRKAVAWWASAVAPAAAHKEHNSSMH